MKSLSMDFSSMLERSCAPPEIIEQEHAIKSGATAMKAKATQENDAKPVIAVVGVGYVGSHLVEAFAKIYEVIAFDVSKVRIEEIARHFEGLTVRATSHPPDLAAADAFLISVPTILNADKSIDTTFLERAVHTIAEQARDGSIVVVESTVAVGMTRHFLSSLATTKTLKVGMSPERVDPGCQFPPFESIPKIVSGIDPSSLEAIHQLYGRVFNCIVPVSSLEVAEMTKLYENCQRMVCAAYANEMADACASLGINAWEASKAAASKPFGYLPFHPGPGVGGDCIPVNPYYLLHTCDMPILKHATEPSWQRPCEIVDRLLRVLNRKRGTTECERGGPGRKIRILLVGVAFKKDQSKLYNSPGVAAIQSLLRVPDVEVEFADPLVDQDDLSFVPKLEAALGWKKKYLEEFDGILVTMDQVGLGIDLLSLLDRVVVHDYSPRLHL